MNWDNEIKSLLRTELSAVETYERAVGERAWDLLRRVQAFHILLDHLEAASHLQTEVQQTTSTPVRLADGSDKWDSWFTLHAAAAKLFSGEATVIDSLVTKQRAHIRALDRLIARL